MGINNSLLKSIQTLVDKAINIAPFDKTRQAQIITNNGDGTYTIRLDGILYNNIPSYPNYNKLKAGIIVKTIIPSNQTSQMYIVAPEDARAFLDFFYPVGSYYDTSDANFNPNVMWGGTWHLLDEGYVLISGSSNGSYKVGTNYGNNTKSYTPSGSVGNHTLNTNQIPSHNHAFGLYKWNSNGTNAGPLNTMPWVYSQGSGSNHVQPTPGTKNFNYDNKGNLMIWNTGGGQAHNHGFTGTAATLDVMQASTPVYRWHRVA